MYVLKVDILNSSHMSLLGEARLYTVHSLCMHVWAYQRVDRCLLCQGGRCSVPLIEQQVIDLAVFGGSVMEHGCRVDWIGVCSLEQGVGACTRLTGSSENISSYSLRKQLWSAEL